MYENVRGRDRGEGESEDSTNDDFVTCQLVSLLTLRKMSLKSNKTSQMSLNRRNGDRNRDRCHGIVEIVTKVFMVTEGPNTPYSSDDDDASLQLASEQLPDHKHGRRLGGD